FREAFGVREKAAGELGQVRGEGQLSTGQERGVAGDDLLHERGARAGESHYEDRLGDIRARLRARQQGDVWACEELPTSLEERIHGVGVVVRAGGLLVEFDLAGDEVVPGRCVVPEPVVQSTPG